MEYENSRVFLHRYRQTLMPILWVFDMENSHTMRIVIKKSQIIIIVIRIIAIFKNSAQQYST